jgi:hypothetical protein
MMPLTRRVDRESSEFMRMRWAQQDFVDAGMTRG